MRHIRFIIKSMTTDIETLQDSRLDVYAKLTDVQLRSKLEPEAGILIAESPKVIQRALDAGLKPLSMLTSARLADKLQALADAIRKADPGAPIFTLPDGELDQLAGFHLAHGALAAFKRPLPLTPEDVLANARRVAILEDITNHTNVGAIFRSAAALGMDGVLITPGCYDPFYRRAVRVSMGAVFQIPWARIGEDANAGRNGHGNVGHAGAWSSTGIPLLHSHGFKVAAMALSDDSISIDDPVLAATPKLALILGTEGEGLAPATIQAADHTVRIPMHAGVDSLNVAAASAVAFWQLRV